MAGIVVKCCIIALVAGIVMIILKEIHLDWSGLCGLLAGIMLMLAAFDMIEQILLSISTFLQQSGLEKDRFTAVIKCMGITFLVDFVAGFCRGQGQLSLATAIETVGRISVCVIAIPFALDLLGLANQIISA